MKTLSFLKIGAVLFFLSLFTSCSTEDFENEENITNVEYQDAKLFLTEYSKSIKDNIKNVDDLNEEIAKTLNYNEQDNNLPVLSEEVLNTESLATDLVYVNTLPGEFRNYSSDHKSFFIEYINALGKSYDNEVLNTIEEYKNKLETKKTSLSADAYKELDLLLYASELAYNDYIEIDSKSFNNSSKLYAKGGFWGCFAGKGKTIGRGIAGGAILGAISGGTVGALGGTVALPGIGTATGAVGGAVFGAALGAVRGGLMAAAWSAADCAIQSSSYRGTLDAYIAQYGPINGPKYFKPFAKLYLTPSELPGDLIKLTNLNIIDFDL
ncbi:hypothetical protein [uncultured Aquimarina sp.]|uniref:glycine zipper family protein n=1 Tax=uncultured Aquimarina sp. TaxID=575652 RepID=UPI0026020F52|nr:hypothetical protein [uncultured Aquimarina sp.]